MQTMNSLFQTFLFEQFERIIKPFTQIFSTLYIFTVLVVLQTHAHERSVLKSRGLGRLMIKSSLNSDVFVTKSKYSLNSDVISNPLSSSFYSFSTTNRKNAIKSHSIVKVILFFFH